MRPANLLTKIFLDGGDPEETKNLIDELGFLDGQTTNPSLISKNPSVQDKLANGEKLSEDQVLSMYKDVVVNLSKLIPDGSISIEVAADKNTSAEAMFAQGSLMFKWIPNAHIKYPTTKAGLTAAERSIKAGMRVNMTLVFTQEQAAGVYAATKGAKKGDVYISPFIGRLDDKGENGTDLIKNILEMYQAGDGHVEVLTASVRNQDHFLSALSLKSDIITAPYKVIKDWLDQGMKVPSEFSNDSPLRSIPLKEFDLDKAWSEFDVTSELTDIGLDKFSDDWNSLIKD